MKKQTFKKLFALIISIMLILSIIPLGTFTVSAEQDGDYIYTVNNGEATITGYNGNGGDITIPSTLGGYPVTDIGDDAFYGCESLTSLIIGKNVTCISYMAFGYCTGLTNVTIPDSVTAIKNYAFYYCSGLTSITIPDGVTSIGDCAFGSCFSLKNITIPNSVTSIGKDVFKNCSYRFAIKCHENSYAMNYAINNHYYLKLDQNSGECLTYFIEDGKANITDCDENVSGYITIPSTLAGYPVTNIESGAFYDCTELAIITIGNSVASIGNQAFYNCSKLANIEIPNSVISIGASAFKGTAYYNNQNNWENGVLYIDNCLIESKSDISGEYRIKDGTRIIADSAFYEHTALESIIIPNSVINIGFSAFERCSSLINLNIPNSVIAIDIFAFRYCEKLTDLTIGNSVTSIGESAFYGCKKLTSVTIPSSVTYVGNRAFGCCYRLAEIINHSSLDNECFKDYTIEVHNANQSKNIVNKNGYLFYTYDNTNYLIGYVGTETNLILPDNYNGEKYQINNSAFRECNNIVSVIIPDNLTIIGDYAFAECSSLSSVTVGNGVKSIGESAFGFCYHLTSIIIGNNVSKIGEYAFENCLTLVEVINHSSLNITKGSTDYGYVGYDALEINNGNESKVVNKDGYLFYTYDNANYLLGYIGTETNLNLPDNYNGRNYQIYKYAFYEEINKSAFFEFHKLTSITIGNGVTGIGNYAFEGCRNLTIYCHENSYAMNYAIENDIKYAFMVIGDPSGDGVVDANDLTYFRKALLTGSDSFDERLDVTGDGKFDLTDLVRIKKHLANNNIPLGKIG